ncbi:MAG: hypothetical protein OEW57_03615, partial [Gammaproteobacteria bacterium]|nr:hypothetical protein [Gammaproteobacteria bacterium]
MLRAKPGEQGGEFCGERRFDSQRRFTSGRRELEPRAREQQSLHAEPLAKQAVVLPLAIGRIAYDRVRLAGEVAAQLMP